MAANPQLAAICLLIQKLGKKIAGGGYEVTVTHLEMAAMSPHGQFQEIPDLATATVRWQYFPNRTIEGELLESFSGQNEPPVGLSEEGPGGEGMPPEDSWENEGGQ